MKLTIYLIFIILQLISYNISTASPPPLTSIFQNFDSFPATKGDEIPSGGDGWQYSSDKTNINPNIARNGWIDSKLYGPGNNVQNLVNYYLDTYNSTHMGFETYGYMEIDGTHAVSGNSLKITITGGKTLDNNSNIVQRGLPVYAKEDTLSYKQAGNSYIDSTSLVGHPYIYFSNTSISPNFVPFPQAQGMNRLSFYINIPAELKNGHGGYANPPQETINVGPYNGVGGHWYNRVYLEGGKWAHILVDGHPQHNNAYSNATSFPYPSSSVRNYGESFFDTMYRWYITFKPYTGIATPPYNIWIDEIGFINDPEPQNCETINTLAVAYDPSTKLFEISFNDKYSNNANSYSTYEVRYSFEPITNGNWDMATKVNIQSDTRYGISANTTGQFKKWWPYYQAVWAPFKIATKDEPIFTPGTTIYFAVKDVSQINGDGMTPVAAKAGRDYTTYASTFDYEGDKPALPLIKRIDFYFSEKMLSIPTIINCKIK